METNTTDTANKPKWELKIPFGLKLTVIVTLILLVSIWIITSLMAVMVSSEFIRTADQTNFEINNRVAAGIEERLYQIRSEGLLLLETVAAAGNNPQLTGQIQNIFFERNPHIGAVMIPGGREIVNRPFFSYNAISPEVLQTWLANETKTLDSAKGGKPALRNASPSFGINLLALFYPWQNSGQEEALVIFFAPQNLLEITGESTHTTIVANDIGDILVSPNFDQVLKGENISTHFLFDTLWKDSGESVRQNYTEAEKRYVGAGHRISMANAAVFSSLEYSIITEQIAAVTRRNIQLSITVMFLTILVAWFFSRIVSTPVKKLIAAAGQIETGDFNLDLKKKSRDELGTLTERFVIMGEELSRWSDAKNLVGRFNNAEISRRAMAGEINLKGEYLDAVVLSAEMVSFGNLFEAADEKSGTTDEKDNAEPRPEPPNAQESLEHLNYLVSLLTDNVVKTGGAVDKITGDRLIAVWGVPFSGGDMVNQVMNCLRCVIMTRNTLWEVNTERASQGKSLYRVNCGIHRGEILAGRVGSRLFSQYTIIGKTLDEAVKAAEACEPVKTDIIITDSVRGPAENQIIFEKIKLPRQFKSNIPLYGLVNLAPAQGQEKQRWPYTLKDVQEYLKGGAPRL